MTFRPLSDVMTNVPSDPRNQTQAGKESAKLGPTLTFSRICPDLIRLFKPDLYGPLILQISIFVMTNHPCLFFVGHSILLLVHNVLDYQQWSRLPMAVEGVQWISLFLLELSPYFNQLDLV